MRVKQPHAQTTSSQDSVPAGSAESVPATTGKVRLFANPGNPDALAAAARVTTSTPARGSGHGEPLRRGSLVAEGTVLGHVLVPHAAKDGHLRFAVQPAGDTGSIDPRPVLANWKELDAALHPQGAKGQTDLLGATASDVFLLSKSQLELAVLSDPGITLDARGRHEVASGVIDRRVLAVLAFLSRSGLKPTVQALHRGPSLSTAAPRFSASNSDTGGAVDISEVNGIPIAGHEGSGSITDSTIRTLLTLQGEYVPNQIASLMKYPDAANTLATRAHANAVQIDFQPLAAALGLTPAKTAKAAHSAKAGKTAPSPFVASAHPELGAVERTAHARRRDPGAEGGRQADLRRDPRPPGRTEQPRPGSEPGVKRAPTRWGRQLQRIARPRVTRLGDRRRRRGLHRCWGELLRGVLHWRWEIHRRLARAGTLRSGRSGTWPRPL